MATPDNGPANYIHDGYTRSGYIAADPQRAHGAIRFVYRPMLVQNRDTIIAKTRQLTDEGGTVLAARSIAGQLVSWDLKNEKGEDVPIEYLHVLRVQPKLFNRMQAVIVLGTEGGDPDPEVKQPGPTTDSLEAALAGASPEQREWKEEKNS